MSTRAIIRIKEKNDVRYVYHQCDGYPEYVGADLQRMLSKKKRWSAKSIDKELIKGILHVYEDGVQCIDDNYQAVDGVCGWESYGYEIDCDNQTLIGYYLGSENLPGSPLEDWSKCERVRPGEADRSDEDVKEVLAERPLIDICTRIRLNDAETIGPAPLPKPVTKIYPLFGHGDCGRSWGETMKPWNPLESWSELLCYIRDNIWLSIWQGSKINLTHDDLEKLCFIWIIIKADGTASVDVDYIGVVGRAGRIPKDKLWAVRNTETIFSPEPNK